MSAATRLHLFLFDPRLGSEENAEGKILFYYPISTPLREQVGVVSLCEAVSAFSETFSVDRCESVHTQRGRLAMLQYEPNVWLVIMLPHTQMHTKNMNTASQSRASASQEYESLPPMEETLQDRTLLALLRRLYGTLRVACGPIRSIADERGHDHCRALLAHVFAPLVRVFIPPGEEDGRRFDLLDTVNCMRFLPIDRRLYLRAQYLVNLVQTSHRSVKHALLLHGEHVVWSSLTVHATQLLFHALEKIVAPSVPIAAAQSLRSSTDLPCEDDPGLSAPAAAAFPDEALLFANALLQRHVRVGARTAPAAGSYLCGMGDLTQDGRSAVRVPCVHLPCQMQETLAGGDADLGEADGLACRLGISNHGGTEATSEPDDGACTRYRLVVFQQQQTSIALLVDETAAADWGVPLWYEALSALLVPELQRLTALLSEHHRAIDDPHRYVYVNRLDAGLKTSVRNMRSGLTSRLGLTQEPRILLNRLHADLAIDEVREVALQAPGAHGWLVGYAGPSRGFYALVEGRDATWSEVHSEVQALCSSRFTNMFLEG